MSHHGHGSLDERALRKKAQLQDKLSKRHKEGGGYSHHRVSSPRRSQRKSKTLTIVSHPSVVSHICTISVLVVINLFIITLLHSLGAVIFGILHTITLYLFQLKLCIFSYLFY